MKEARTNDKDKLNDEIPPQNSDSIPVSALKVLESTVPTLAEAVRRRAVVTDERASVGSRCT